MNIVTEGEVNLDPASGAAIVFDGTSGDQVSITGLNIVGGSFGIYADVANSLAGLTLVDVDFDGVASNAIFLANDAVGSVNVTGGTIRNTGETNGNTAQVKLYGFTGSASFTDMSIFGGEAGDAVFPDGAFEILGISNADMGSGVASPDIGNVSFNNVVVTGDFNAAPVGIYNYASLDNLVIDGTGSSVGLDLAGTNSGWNTFPASGVSLGVNFDGITGDVDVTGYEVTAPSNGVAFTLQGEKAGQADESIDGQTFTGSAGDDVINGKLGNDVIDGKGGNDLVDGGDGIDSLVLAGSYSDYDPVLSGSSVTLTHKVTGEVLTFTNVEVLDFETGADVHLVGFAGSDYATIQSAITAADALNGDIVLVGGSHSENVDLNKNVDLIGVPGAEIGSLIFNAGGASSADRLTVEGISVTGGVKTNGQDHIGLHNVTLTSGASSYALEIKGNSEDISITDTVFNIEAGETGLKVDSATDVDGLVIKNSEFNGGMFGIYIANNAGTSGDSVSGRFEGVSFNGQETLSGGTKSSAIYAEKMSDITMTNITVIASTNVTTALPRGINLNLKYEAFENISIDGLSFQGFDVAHAGMNAYNPQLIIDVKPTATLSGLDINNVIASSGTGTTGSSAIVVDIFSENPTTPITDVSFTGSTITGDVKIQVSEYDSVDGNNITGNLDFVLVEPGSSVAGNLVSGDITFSVAEDATLPEGADNLVLLPGAGNIDGTGNAGDNVITGNEGDNVITGGGGVDTIDGGAGNDTAVYADVSSIVFDTIAGKWTVTSPTDGTETLTDIETIEVAGARTLLVGGGGFATLAEAIAAANPAGGDTILLSASVHDILGSGVVTVDRQVFIKGANAGVDGDGVRGTESVIDGRLNITAAGVEIDGVKFLHNDALTGSGRNIVSITATDVSISNSVFESTVFGGNAGGIHDVAVFVGGLATGTVNISDNLFQGDPLQVFGKYSTAAWGRAVWSEGGGVQTIIDGNTIRDARSAINLENPNDAVDSINGNLISNGGSGISLANVAGVITSITGNTFTGVDTDVNGNGATDGFALDFAGTGNQASDASYVVYSGSGADTLTGTDGNDAFVYRTADKMEAGEIVDGGAGVDAIVYEGGGGSTLTLSSGVTNVEEVRLVGSSAANLDASAVAAGAGNDGLDIFGNASANQITGSQGNDTIDAGGGVDQVVYTDASLSLVAGKWTATSASDVDTLLNVEQVYTDGVAAAKTLLVGAGGYATIQDAIDAAASGDTILIAEGSYAGNINVNKDNLTIEGVGVVTIEGSFNADNGIDPLVANSTSTFFHTAASYDNGSGDGLNINASGVTLKGLAIASFYRGINFGDNVSNVNITDVDVRDTVTAINKAVDADITNITITGGSLTDSYQGILFAKANADDGYASGITIDGTLFSELTEKGIYVETLSNSTITGITMTNVGEFGRGDAFDTLANVGEYGTGIDLNLKFAAPGVPYSNIVIENFTFTGVGTSAGVDSNPLDFGAAIAVKVRDDGATYGANPGSYDGAVIIRNGTIDGTSTGIRVGEPGKTVGGPNVAVSNVGIVGAIVAEVDNVSLGKLSVVLTAGADTYAAASTTTGVIEISGGAGVDTITTGGGDDIITGGAGADVLNGGAGNDTFVYDTPADLVGDQINGGAGTDTVKVNGAANDTFVLSLAPGASVEAVVMAGAAATNLNASGSTADLSITGNGAANIIQGGSGNDIIMAGGGDDTIIHKLGDGTDSANGGAGNDTLKVTGGASATPLTLTLAGSGVLASMVATGAAASQVNTDGVETINLALDGSNAKTVDASGLQSGVVVRGSLGAGNDTFKTGKGADSVDGGAGFDTLDFSHIANGISVNLGAGTALGTGVGGDFGLTNFEAVIGTSHTDVITGSSGNNTFYATAGGDAIFGGGGSDTYDASQQTSSLEVDLSPLAGNAYAVGEGIGLTTLVGITNISGGSANDVIRGSSVANGLYGGSGNDTIYGLAGNDTIEGGDGDDVLVGGAGKDFLSGGAGADRFVYENASDSMAGDLRDIITHWDSSDRLDFTLMDANSTLSGRQGFTFVGLGSADRTVAQGELKYYQVNGKTYLVGGIDADDQADFQIEINSNTPFDPNQILGLSKTVLTGDAYSNNLVGTYADDIITGLGGRDFLTGGAGADTFVFKATSDSAVGSMRDVILDWESADKIDLSAIDANTNQVGNQSFSFVGLGSVDRNVGQGEVKYYQVGGNTYVVGDVNGDGDADFQIEISGLHTLTASNFVSGGLTLVGDASNNILHGSVGNDIFIGGGGRDILYGGGGSDRYILNSASDSAAGNNRDILADFDLSDIIDVSQIDARVSAIGNNDFTFLGLGTADRQVAEGAIKYYHVNGNTYVVGSVDADGEADFQIEIRGVFDLTSANFDGLF